MNTSAKHFSPRASLAALGLRLRRLRLLEAITAAVRVPQKTVRHTPAEELYDAFLAIPSGAHGLSEINTRLRSDPTLQRAFGRPTCAEDSLVQDSLVQDSLDACTPKNVGEVRESKQGVGINRRRKKRAAARTMLTLLGTLAHNVLVWAREWLAEAEPRLRRYGVVRLLRDVLSVSGFVETDGCGAEVGVALNRGSTLARLLAGSLREVLSEQSVAVSPGGLSG